MSDAAWRDASAVAAVSNPLLQATRACRSWRIVRDARARGPVGVPALLVVLGAFVLTGPGRWTLTDQKERLYTAQRILEAGTIELADPGAGGVAAVPWVEATAGGHLRTRHHPLTSVTLVPLLAIDRAFGWSGDPEWGRIVHWQGVLVVSLTLVLAGLVATACGATPGGAGVAMIAIGLAWPVWHVARAGGPEPWLGFFVVTALAADVFRARFPRRAAAVQFASNLFLPWTHPTGVLLSAGNVVASVLSTRGRAIQRLRSAGPGLAGALVGCLGVVLLWNHLYHGNWLAGGYGLYPAQNSLAAVSLANGFWHHARVVLPQLAVVVVVIIVGRPRGVPTAVWAYPVVALSVLLVFFSAFSHPEPERRLAAAIPAWVPAVALAWSRWSERYRRPPLLAATSFALGLHHFMGFVGRYLEGPGGQLYPDAFWVGWIIRGAPVAQWSAPVLLALASISVGAARLQRQARSASPDLT